MKNYKIVILSLFILINISFVNIVNAQEGHYGSYLVGSFYKSTTQRTFLHIINPTLQHLNIKVLFFRCNGHFLTCRRFTLDSNSCRQIDVNTITLIPNNSTGLVKILSYYGNNTQRDGIVGFQRIKSATNFYIESNLAAVPIGQIMSEINYLHSITCH